MALFDAYVFVDWSGRNGPSPPNPSPDAVWVGELRWSRARLGGRGHATYWRTRHDAVLYIERRLRGNVEAGLKTLIGFDFPYGYPAGFAAALGADGSVARWQYVWDVFTLGYADGPSNQNNRFQLAEAMNVRCRSAGPGPFWCCPLALSGRWLTVKRPPALFPFAADSGRTLAEFRLCDRRVLTGGRRIHSVWQLLGTGSVGGQALAGIPYVNRLRHAPGIDSVSRVWPFETGFTGEPLPSTGPAVLHAEIWPSLANPCMRPGDDPKDRSQVLAMLRWISEVDRNSNLGAFFARPRGLDMSATRAASQEEGWILGVR